MEAVLKKNIRVATGDEILGTVDLELLEAIRAERGRQCDQIELIASENYVSDIHALRSPTDETLKRELRDVTRNFCDCFPVPGLES